MLDHIKSVNLITTHFAYPAIDGMSMQINAQLEFLLKQGAEVHLISLHRAKHKLDTKRFYEKFPAVTVTRIPYQGTFTSLTSKLFVERILYSVFQVRYGITRTLLKSLETSPADILHLWFIPLISFPVMAVKTPSVFSENDSWSLRQLRLGQVAKRISQKFFYFGSFIFCAFLEFYYYKQFQVVHFVSGEDVQYSRKIRKMTNYAAIPVRSAIDLEEFEDLEFKKEARSGSLLLWGPSSVQHIRDGMIRFIREMDQCRVSGRVQVEVLSRGKCPAELKTCIEESNSDIAWLSWVDDIVTYLRRFDVVVFTDLTGTGLKNRVIMAALVSVPIVTTEAAIEGIPLKHQAHVTVVSTPEEACAKAMQIMKMNGQEWQQLETRVKAAKKQIQDFVDDRRIDAMWEKLYADLYSLRGQGEQRFR